MPEETVVEPVVTEPVPQAQEPAPADPEPKTPQEPEAKPEGEEPPRDAKGKFKSPIQDRFDELTRNKHEAEREAAYWRARANPEPIAEPAKKPTAEDFKDYAEFVEALTDWKTDQKVAEALKARDTETAKSAEQRAQDARHQAFAERITQGKAAIADYDEVVSAAADAPVYPHVEEAIRDSDKAADLIYHFSKHPEELARLNGMPPLSAAREMGRIEALFGQKASVTKPTTQAPAPMRPAGKGAATSATSDPSKMSNEEYRAYRKGQGASWAR